MKVFNVLVCFVFIFQLVPFCKCFPILAGIFTLKRLFNNFDRDLHIRVDRIFETKNEKERDYRDVADYDDDNGDGYDDNYAQNNGDGYTQSYDQNYGQNYGQSTYDNTNIYDQSYTSTSWNGGTKFKSKTNGNYDDNDDQNGGDGLLRDLAKLFKGKSVAISFEKPRDDMFGFGFGVGNGKNFGRFGRGLRMWRMHHTNFHGPGNHDHRSPRGVNGHVGFQGEEAAFPEYEDAPFHDHPHERRRPHTSSKQHRHGQGDAHEHAHGHGAHHGSTRVDNSHSHSH